VAQPPAGCGPLGRAPLREGRGTSRGCLWYRR
jgi:hypothetical protein